MIVIFHPLCTYVLGRTLVQLLPAMLPEILKLVVQV